MLEMLNIFKGLFLDELRKMFNSLIIKKLIIKKANSENVSSPQSRSFERRICAQTQDLQIFKIVLYVSNESERSFPQHCILSSITLHSRSLPLNSLAK